MNSNSPVATGAAAVSGVMLGGVISWLCSVIKVPAPPADVAGTIGAGLLISAHVAYNWISTRFPAPVAAPAAVPVSTEVKPV